MLINLGKPKMLFEGDPGAGGNPGGDPPATPPADQGLDWGKLRETLPEDIRADKSLETITSLEGLTKSYIHAQKAIGKDKIVVPDKHATPDDWNGIFTKLGNPAKVEDYKMNLGEDVKVDPTILGELTKIAHSKGVLPWQMEEIVKGYSGIVNKAREQYETQSQTQHQERVDSLKKAWGKEYDGKVKEAQAAMTHLLPDAEDQQALIDSGYGDHPAVLKLLANARKLMSDDQIIGAGSGELVMTPEDALAKARTIQGDSTHPYRNPTHPNHKSAKEEVAALYKIAFPE